MSQRFNPPPNWPVPPEGWAPPPGWLPDPAWGPPPEGWRFWVEESTSGSNGFYYRTGALPQASGKRPDRAHKRRRAFWLVASAIVMALFAGCAINASISSSASESQLGAKERPSVSQEQIDSATELSERNLALLVKDPESHKGQTIVLYARITQFDAATGACTFRANIAYKRMENTWDYEENSVFRGGDGYSNCPALSGFVNDDEVRITATSLGSVSYETQIHGNTTVPAFRVEEMASVK